jgi:hypothetical protein
MVRHSDSSCTNHTGRRNEIYSEYTTQPNYLPHRPRRQYQHFDLPPIAILDINADPLYIPPRPGRHTRRILRAIPRIRLIRARPTHALGRVVQASIIARRPSRGPRAYILTNGLLERHGSMSSPGVIRLDGRSCTRDV